MRITLKFLSKSPKGITLPIHYNEILQGFIYRHLEKSLAGWLHSDGYKFGKRSFKLFTFSRLSGKYRIDKGTITFLDSFSFKIASPNADILESLAIHLIKKKTVSIARRPCLLESIEVLNKPSYALPLRVRALSPITVYRTLYGSEKVKKTYYFSPQEKEFNELILKNLGKKVEAFYDDASPFPDLADACIKPVNVKNRHLSIINYKGFVIKGWMGTYELNMPEPYLSMALDAGLGAKNSQGFGMVESVKRRAGDVNDQR